METVRIKNDELPQIASTFTRLIENTDKHREKFSSALIAIFTPVTSGLLFLAINTSFISTIQKVLYLIIISSSSFVVLLALTEKFMYFKISKSAAQSFIEHLNKTGTHTVGPIHGKDWESSVLAVIIYLMAALVVVNVVADLLFVYARIM